MTTRSGCQLDEEKPLGRIKWVAVDGEENGLIKEQVWLRGEVLAEISYTRLMRLEKE